MPDEGVATVFEKDDGANFHNYCMKSDEGLWNREMESGLSEQLKKMVGFR